MLSHSTKVRRHKHTVMPHTMKQFPVQRGNVSAGSDLPRVIVVKMRLLRVFVNPNRWLFIGSVYYIIHF